MKFKQMLAEEEGGNYIRGELDSKLSKLHSEHVDYLADCLRSISGITDVKHVRGSSHSMFGSGSFLDFGNDAFTLKYQGLDIRAECSKSGYSIQLIDVTRGRSVIGPKSSTWASIKKTLEKRGNENAQKR